jgi:homogentisate 1,2-dioxygenase
VGASIKKEKTDEVAVMIESRRPFTVMRDLETVEVKDYAMSWRKP